jgi:mercuric ion transport protein
MSGHAGQIGAAPGARRRSTEGERASMALLPALGLLAAIGASSCCLVPLALFAVGVSGAWIGNLTAMAPYQPIWIAIALACLAGGFWKVYRRPAATACAEGSYCANPASTRLARLALWSAAALVTAAVGFPYAARFLL